MYIGKETRIFKRLFKNTNICTSSETTNTIKNHLKPKNELQILLTKAAFTN
jgi:hypothetical protein